MKSESKIKVDFSDPASVELAVKQLEADYAQTIAKEYGDNFKALLALLTRLDGSPELDNSPGSPPQPVNRVDQLKALALRNVVARRVSELQQGPKAPVMDAHSLSEHQAGRNAQLQTIADKILSNLRTK